MQPVGTSNAAQLLRTHHSAWYAHTWFAQLRIDAQFRVVLPHEKPSDAKYVYAPSNPTEFPSPVSSLYTQASLAPPDTYLLAQGRAHALGPAKDR